MSFYCETILDKFLPIKLKQGLKKNNTMGKNLSIVTLSLLLLLASTGNALNVFDVRTYGAHPNADITQVCCTLQLILMRQYPLYCIIDLTIYRLLRYLII